VLRNSQQLFLNWIDTQFMDFECNSATSNFSCNFCGLNCYGIGLLIAHFHNPSARSNCSFTYIKLMVFTSSGANTAGDNYFADSFYPSPGLTCTENALVKDFVSGKLSKIKSSV
jgi:hypothetical protein